MDENWTLTATEAARSLVEEREQIQTAIIGHEKRLAGFRNELDRLRRHRDTLLAEQLKVVSGESELSSLRFDKDRRDCEQQIVNREADADCLEQEILPKARAELQAVEQRLQKTLLGSCLARLPEVESAMLQRLDDLLEVLQQFADDSDLLFGDAGLSAPTRNYDWQLLRFMNRLHAIDTIGAYRAARESRAAREQKTAEVTLTVETITRTTKNRPPTPSTIDDLPLGGTAGGPAVETLLTGVADGEKKVAGVSETIRPETEIQTLR